MCGNLSIARTVEQRCRQRSNGEMDKIIFDKNTNCNTCKYGYFEDFDITGWHNMCGKWNCYLCQSNYGYCYDYEKGTPPEDKQHM